MFVSSIITHVPKLEIGCKAQGRQQVALASMWMLTKRITCVFFFLKKGDISPLNGGSLKLENQFTYLGRSVSSTKNVINIRLAKALTAIDRLSIIWKSDDSDKIKCIFFQAFFSNHTDTPRGRWLSVLRKG